MHTLINEPFVNDGVIIFFFKLLDVCDERGQRENRSRFKSHFIPKMYERTNCFSYERVAKWSKNVPGGDIFSLDKVFVPFHVGDSHCSCAVIFMDATVVRYSDSLGGGAGGGISNDLIKYIKF